MPYCFVIQPFDGGRFDKRFSDVFKPAIEAAGLDPYRVDRDVSVSIPINDIEQGIRGAAVCFADITLDNPNVWFELGYALASEKEICIICSKERVEKFPFDVQHRSIIRYSVDSSSDYLSLQGQIAARLTAILEKVQKLAVFSTTSPMVTPIDVTIPPQNAALTYPLKCYVTLRNDSTECADVRLSEYRPQAVTLRQFPLDVPEAAADGSAG